MLYYIACQYSISIDLSRQTVKLVILRYQYCKCQVPKILCYLGSDNVLCILANACKTDAVYY